MKKSWQHQYRKRHCTGGKSTPSRIQRAWSGHHQWRERPERPANTDSVSRWAKVLFLCVTRMKLQLFYTKRFWNFEACMIWYPNDIGMLQGLSDLLFELYTITLPSVCCWPILLSHVHHSIMHTHGRVSNQTFYFYSQVRWEYGLSMYTGEVSRVHIHH